MAVIRPFNLKKWIDDNRHLLKPPVGNQQVYKEVDDFIVMVVGGPNSRKDFHYNETEELFYQLEGDITVRIIEDGKIVPIAIKEGDMFLLPAKVPHSPQRGPNTVGLVIERVRPGNMKDSFSWYCENCSHQLYERFVPVDDIVGQLPPIMEDFYADVEKRTCKNCGTIMEPPAKL
ncbi:MAG TPA: 3-hydroxyanthranilate 3,4-dioxygenase [Edaphocola sp.]|nr:3-hydroxyanthranilate 3,4-dioxygenase [Edaphocola sp.]